jgi:DNA/RNA endonuclease YhcR with UshA esterase domain
MNGIVRAIALASVALWPGFAAAATLTTDEAAHHVGENATVCGTIASASYASHSKGRPTFLDFDKPHPNETFAAVIWATNRAKLKMPDSTLLGKEVCVTGVIKLFRGRPEVIL